MGRLFKVGGHGLRLGQRGRVVLGQAVLLDKALGHGAGQLGHGGLDLLNPFGGNDQRRQVGVRKVAVIGRIFLGAHGAGFARVWVEQHGGLLDGVAVFELLDLPADFVINGLLHVAKRVQIFDLAARAQRLARLAHADVGIAAKRAFLHVAVANADPGDDFVQLFGVGHGLGTGAHVRLGDNFQQRRAGTVQVNARFVGEQVVDGFARIFFQVGAHQAHGFFLVAQIKADLAALHHGDFKLADLVALGQVGVEIIFAGKNAARGHVRAQGQAQLDGAFDRLFVHHRQRAGQGQADGAGLGVGLGAKGGAGAAEDFAGRGQLGVGFKADDDFVTVDQRGSHGVQSLKELLALVFQCFQTFLY